MHDSAPELNHILFQAQGDQNDLTVLQKAVSFQQQPAFAYVAGSPHAAAQMAAVLSKYNIIHQIQGLASLKFPSLEILHVSYQPPGAAFDTGPYASLVTLKNGC